MKVDGRPVRAFALLQDLPVGVFVRVVELDGTEPEFELFTALAKSGADVAVLLTGLVPLEDLAQRIATGQGAVSHPNAVCLVDLRQVWT